MAKSRNDILFRFLSDTRSLEKGTKKAKKSLGGVQSAARSMAGTLAVAFGAREIARFASNAVNAASEFEESINAVEQATGFAAKEIFALGETSADSLGLSSTAVNKAAVAFSAFGRKINSKDVAGVFEEFITRAVDFGSVMDLDVSEALLKFQSGLAGESEPLRRFGIDVSAAAVSLEAMAIGLSETGKNLTEAEKVQARYSLILKQTDRFAGDFEKTSDGLANTQRRLNAAWEDAQVAIGSALLEPMADILDVAIDLIPVVTGVAGAFSTLAVDAAGVVKPLSDVLDVISETVGKADDLTGGTGFLDSALSQLGKNIISGPRDAFLNLRDAVIDVNEWLSATDEEGIRISKSLSAAGLSMFELTRDTILGAAAMRDFDAAVAGADDELNVFDAGAAIQAMRDLITLRQILGGGGSSTGFGGGGDIVGLAHGGTIQPGGSALVGERGPEIISPRGGARITPINGSGGGGGTVINVEFSGVVGDPTAVAEQIQDLIELYGRTNNAF